MHHSRLRPPLQLFLALLAAISIVVLSMGKANAELLTGRSIVVSTAVPSAIATHTFQFTYVSPNPVGSVVFEYCDNSPIFAFSCNAPAGLDVTPANLVNQTGNTGYSIDGADTTANKIVITRSAAAPVLVSSTYQFSNITNPSNASESEFVRISTYGSTDGSGPLIDSGAVAFATVSPFNVGANVPPFIKLCVAITVAPDCSSMSGDQVELGTLTTASVRAGTSQFAVGTNSVSGYIVFIQGTTMTSGNNSISALTTPTPSFPGNNQFGINLRNNSVPNIGSDPFGSGSGTVTPNYNTVNQYMLVSGDSIAQSTLPSNYNRMTVSYITNIKPSQPPGVYSTTCTYLSTANF